MKRRSRGPWFSPSNRQNDILFRGMVIPLNVNIHKKIPNLVLAKYGGNGKDTKPPLLTSSSVNHRQK